MKNWRPFLFPYHGPGSVPQGLSSFHPAPPRLLCAAARPQPCALGGLCRGAAQGLPPPYWVLPGNLSGAGQGTSGIFVREGGKFPGCYVTGFSKTGPALYPLKGGISLEESEGQNAKSPKARKSETGGTDQDGQPAAEKEVLLVAGKTKKTTTGKTEKPVVMSGAVPEWSSTTAISKLLGKTVRRIQQLTQEGVLETEVPPGGGARKYRTCETVQRYIAHVEQKAQETGENSRAAELNLKKLQAEVDLKESQGQLHRLKTAIAEGKYISADQATEELAEFLATFKKFAMNIPPRMAGTMSSYADAVTVRAMEKTMRKELEALLAAFSDGAVAEQAEDGEP